MILVVHEQVSAFSFNLLNLKNIAFIQEYIIVLIHQKIVNISYIFCDFMATSIMYVVREFVATLNNRNVCLNFILPAVVFF